MPVNLKKAEEIRVSVDIIKNYMVGRGVSRMINSISESGHRISEIINNMLSFYRKGDNVLRDTLITDLLDKTLKMEETDHDLKRGYDFRTIEITKEYEIDLPPVPCEGSKIQQILLNILQNGAQAMFEAACTKPVFIIRLRMDKENMLVIEIEDNGPGMDDEIRKQIFDPFFTTKSIGVGTGLGLSISYFIITKSHKGTMSVKTHPGQGTTFIIQLLLAENDNRNEK